MGKKLIVLTGAGISAESGIQTFRDADGLWEGHDVMEVASPEGFKVNPKLVLDFYNLRRAQLQEVHPNKCHLELAALEEEFEITIITQNVDDLHERGGSSKIIHLHGELTKVRSVAGYKFIQEWNGDLNLGDLDSDGHQLRPHIVWFGEAVPEMERAVAEIKTAEIVLIIGTSMQVYPAAGLVGFAPPSASIFYIDPKPTLNFELRQMKNLTVIDKKATVGILTFLEKMKRDN